MLDVSRHREADVHAGPSRIEGVFGWPHDPFFRPLVGLFSKGRLIQIVPSVRRPYLSGGRWGCYFVLDTADDSDLRTLEDVDVTCLETSEFLYSSRRKPPEQRPRHPLSVEEIVELGRRESQSFDYAGFPSFLRLPLVDEISIFYLDFLQRVPDPKAIDSYRASVKSGKASILDVRDEIATSEEAQEYFETITFEDRRGKWCLWAGIEQVLLNLVPPPLFDASNLNRTGAGAESMLRSSFEEIECPSDVAGILADVAVGRTTDVTLYTRWIRDNGSAISDVESQVGRSVARRAAGIAAKRQSYKIGALLAAMTIGAAGLRAPDGTVRAKAGLPGHLIYGPYLRLAPGRHALLCEVAIDDSVPAAGRIAMEVVYANVLLARKDILSGEAHGRSFRLDFAIPGANGLLDEAKFEFRIWTDGAADVEIRSLSLEVGTDRSVRNSPPCIDNWLLLLEPGQAGTRTAGTAIAALPKSGHVFYGPYQFFLPGDYSFVLECKADAILAPEPVTLEAIGLNGHALSQERFHIDVGYNRLSIPVRIPSAPNVGDLVGPIEFRLDKTGLGEFVCVKAEFLAASTDPEDAGARTALLR